LAEAETEESSRTLADLQLLFQPNVAHRQNIEMPEIIQPNFDFNIFMGFTFLPRNAL